MYCEKLLCIKENKKSPSFLIDDLVINKLDVFIKEKVTLIERERLSPSKFALLMNVDQNTAMMTFVIGTECRLFKALAYFTCECGENHFLESVKGNYECVCNKVVNLSENRERIFLYFKLLLAPENCFNEEEKIYHIDYIENDIIGNFSLADMEERLGKETVDSILSLKELRNNTMRRQAEG